MAILSIEANSVGHYQTTPIGTVRYVTTLFVIEANKTFQQTTEAGDLGCVRYLWVKYLSHK